MAKRSKSARLVLVAVLLLAVGVLFAVVMELVRETGPRRAEATPVVAALHEAARKGDAAAVRSALANGADVNASTQEAPAGASSGLTGMTPLMWAAYEGNVETVRALLESKARVDARADDGRTALMFAAGWGDEERVRALLAAPTLVASATERERVVNMSVPEGGWTALMFSAACGTAGSMRALLEAGADIDARNKWRQTALMAAARAGDNEKVQLLLKAGATVDQPDIDANTALALAAASEAPAQVLESLLQAGAKADAPDFEGVTPLMKAAYRGDLAHLKALLASGASRASKDRNGWNAAAWALSRNDDLGKQAAELLRE